MSCYPYVIYYNLKQVPIYNQLKDKNILKKPKQLMFLPNLYNKSIPSNLKDDKTKLVQLNEN